jgi:hypothetical protein
MRVTLLSCLLFTLFFSGFMHLLGSPVVDVDGSGQRKPRAQQASMGFAASATESVETEPTILTPMDAAEHYGRKIASRFRSFRRTALGMPSETAPRARVVVVEGDSVGARN